jgi:hypothetical protein
MASTPTPQESRWRLSAAAMWCCRSLASVRLAIVLIVVLAIVLAGATFLEKATSPDTTQWYVYHSPWFIGLLAIIAVNILASTLIRFPWGLRRIGFVITHVGVLMVMAGAMQTFWSGVEGRLVVIEGAKPCDEIALGEWCQLSVGWPGQPEEAVLPFNPGPSDWPDGKTRDFDEVDGVSLKVLKFYRHARPQLDPDSGAAGKGGHGRVTYRPVEINEDDSESSDAVVLVAVTVGGSTQEVWLRKLETNDPSFRRDLLLTPKGPLALSFTSELQPLDLSVRLLKFQRGLNPGGMGDASFASSVEVIDKARRISEKHEVSMNQPLAVGKFTFYQSSYVELADGRNASILTAAYDPGRFLKYFGSAMTCGGMLVVFSLSISATIAGLISSVRSRENA